MSTPIDLLLAKGMTALRHSGTESVLPSKTETFAALMLAQYGKTQSTGTTGETEEAAAAAEQAPTLEEFKREFMALIDAMPIHPSQAGARQSISIHDKAFEKMLEDPEFAEGILEQIRSDLAADYGIASPAFCTMRFDENGVYSGSSGGSFHMDKFERESADAFWRREPVTGSTGYGKSTKEVEEESRREKREKLEELLDILAQKRRTQARNLQESYHSRFRSGEGGYSFESEFISPISTFGFFL